MRVIVTGGAGFIGANLVRRLVAEGDFEHVVAVDDLSTGRRENLAGVGCELVEASVLDAGLIAEACAEADAIVHLAARPSVPRSLEDPVASHEANATGTLAVLEAARRAGDPHVIVASSSSVYGANPALPKHEDLPVAPLSPYAVSKLATEGYAQAFAHSFGLDTLALRLFNVFGPLQPAGHDYAAAIPAFVDAALAGRAVPVHGDGHQTRDFTYVGSVCAAVVEALRRRVTHDGPVNLAFGTRQTLLEAIATLESQLATELTIAHTEPRPGDVRHSQADQTRLRSLLPDVEPVPFDVGLAETLQWFRRGT
jgi:UDP-glucose 4-epimerase